MPFRASALALILCTALWAAAPPAGWWPSAVEERLSRAGANRVELLDALRQTPARQREGMAFLIANMPERDLRSLSAAFLLEDIDLAYRARALAPWGRRVPDDVFLDAVLPYANLDEPRDAWRKQLREVCLPIVQGCKTPAEAAQKINATLFGKVKVRYSTGRKRANQSPKESMASGLASCTGLSILLVDACRSVGIPARVVGTPLWANKSGNHTWVEVWDGRWMFTGAAEQDPNGMDRGWFVHNASQARADDPVHAIYAATFRRTGVVFPLPWAPRSRDFHAENVTARYARARPEKLARVLIGVVAAGTKKRLVLPVVVEEKASRREKCRGVSKGELADTNDLLAFELQPGRRYVVRVGAPVRAEAAFTARGAEQTITVEVPAADAALAAELTKQARRYFEATPERRAAWKFNADLEALLAKDDQAARQAVWVAYRSAAIHQGAKKDFDDRVVRHDRYVSAYTVKEVGKKPPRGWPVFIALHGGGGAPKSVNDRQWKVMQRYYHDQPSVPGYLYVALRAPNDAWNGFYDGYVPPLIANLIRQLALFGDADLDKVFLMGYSHGGYGAFYVGPRIPDRFAAVHASAAAPSDGDAIAHNLRHLPFSFMIGEKDTAHGRIGRCKAFGKALEKLKADNVGDYLVTMELKLGMGHGGLPDRDKIKELYPHRRAAAPSQLTWEVVGGSMPDFYWLSVPKPGGGQAIEAAIRDNKVTLTTRQVEKLDLRLDARLMDFRKPLSIILNGKTRELKVAPSLAVLCRTMAERGDPYLAGSCVVPLTPP
jgi:transglutaminase-like putative cysteine protease/predicted esterase